MLADHNRMDALGTAASQQNVLNAPKAITSLLVLCMLPRLATLWERGFYSDDFFFLQRTKDMSLMQALADTWSIYGGLRPIGYALMTVQYHVIGDFAPGHQLLLLGLHLLCTLLLYRLLIAVFQHQPSAWVGAAFFGLVPWTLQTTVWTVCALNLVAAACVLWSAILFWAAARSPIPAWKSLLAASIVFGVGLLCYEQFLVWFAVWPLIAALARPRGTFFEWLRISAPMMIVAVLAALFIVALSPESERQSNPVTDVTHILQGFVIRVKRALVEHVWLSMSGVRSYHLSVLADWIETGRVWALLVVCIAATSAACIAVSRSAQVACATGTSTATRGVLELLTALTLTLAPISILAMLPGAVMEQRAMYPVTIGMAFIVALGMRSAWVRVGMISVLRVPFAVLVAIALSLLATATATRSEGWAKAWQHEQRLGMALQQVAKTAREGAFVVVDGFPDTLPGSVLVTGNEHGMRNLGHWFTGRKNLTVTTKEEWDRLRGEAAQAQVFGRPAAGEVMAYHLTYDPGRKMVSVVDAP